MIDLYNLVSNIDLDEQFRESFRTRYLDQKFLYLDEGAKLFYQEKSTDLLYGVHGINHEILDILDIKKTLSRSKNKPNLFISLGCGDSHIEKYVYNYMKGFSSDFQYFGVDSSRSMLDMSFENIDSLNLSHKLICADFFSRDFKNEIIRLSEGNYNRLYAMFGNVFGNLNPTKIISTLNNILRSGDKLWIDVRLKKGSTVGDDLQLFNHYCQYLKSQKQVDFFSNIFLKLGIPKENFCLYVTTFNDQVLGSLRFDFRINFTKKTVVNVSGDDFTILPDENIRIVHIYAYDYYKLISFFKEHGLELKKMFKDENRGHFIFEKI